MKSPGQKLVYFVFGGLLEALTFCLVWNELKVYEAVGHGLGTVNYWTVLGVDYSVAFIFAVMGSAWYSGKITAEEYSFVKENQ